MSPASAGRASPLTTQLFFYNSHLEKDDDDSDNKDNKIGGIHDGWFRVSNSV